VKWLKKNSPRDVDRSRAIWKQPTNHRVVRNGDGAAMSGNNETAENTRYVGNREMYKSNAMRYQG
jgi:hypothetical protein